MLKRPTFIFCVIASVIVIMLFRVKYEVSALETTVSYLKQDIRATKEALHVLKAEWSHLNDPKSLQILCAKYLPHLKPIHSAQLITFQDMIQAGQRSAIDKNLDLILNQALEQDELDQQDVTSGDEA